MFSLGIRVDTVLHNKSQPPHTLHIRLPQDRPFWLDSFCSSGKAVGVGAMCSCTRFRLCDMYEYMWEQRFTQHRIYLIFMKYNKIKCNISYFQHCMSYKLWNVDVHLTCLQFITCICASHQDKAQCLCTGRHGHAGG